MKNRLLKNGTEVGAWMLTINPEVWDVIEYATMAEPITTFRLTDGPRVDLMEPGDECVLWVLGKPRHNFRPGVWAIGEVTEEAWDNRGDDDDEFWLDEDERLKERPYLGVNLRFLPEPVPTSVFAEDPAFADAEILHQPKIGNPLVLRPHEYAVVTGFLDNNDLWPDDPELDALLDAADALATSRLEADGWTIDEHDEPPYLTATRDGVTREVFIAATTSGPRFPFGPEEYDAMEADGEARVLVVVAIPDDEGDPDPEANGNGNGDGSGTSRDDVQVVAVHEAWRPVRELYNRTSQLHTW